MRVCGGSTVGEGAEAYFNPHIFDWGSTNNSCLASFTYGWRCSGEWSNQILHWSFQASWFLYHNRCGKSYKICTTFFTFVSNCTSCNAAQLLHETKKFLFWHIRKTSHISQMCLWNHKIATRRRTSTLASAIVMALHEKSLDASFYKCRVLKISCYAFGKFSFCHDNFHLCLKLLDPWSWKLISP